MADQDDTGEGKASQRPRSAKLVAPGERAVRTRSKSLKDPVAAAAGEPRLPTTDTDPPAVDAAPRGARALADFAAAVDRPTALDAAGPGGAPPSAAVAAAIPDARPAGEPETTLTLRERFKTDWDFVRRVLIALGLGALAYLLYSITDVLLLVFAAVLFAVVLQSFAAFLSRRARVPERWSLMAAVILVVLIAGGILFLFGAQMRGQIAQLSERLPLAVNTFAKEFGVQDVTQQAQEMMGGNAPTLARQIAGFGFTALGALADLLLVVVAAIYMASEPRLYRKGLVKLFPKSQHQRVDDALEAAGHGLTLWFHGQLISMLIVGTLSTLAYWLIGLPGALALGLIAGVTNFIPLLGPIIGAVPAVLIAFSAEGSALMWTLLAALVIQQIEGNVIMPIVERRAVQLPPALALFAIVAAGLLFGFMGVFLAVPITVVVFILVKKLYVRQTLGEETEVPGEEDRKPEVDESRIAGKT